MEKQFFIIMGKPGSGKGTQAQLLKAVLEQSHKDVIHVTTGGSFREFIEQDTFMSSRAKQAQNIGLLQPEFLSIWNWTQVFISKMKEDTTVILDGAPRKLPEVEALHGLFPFLGYAYPPIIYVDVTDAWSKDRMKYRGATSAEKRPDTDSDTELDKRIEEFNTHILPCVDAFKRDPRYRFIHINGEQSIEDVHKDIMKEVQSQ
jgi:adenylate kinase